MAEPSRPNPPKLVVSMPPSQDAVDQRSFVNSPFTGSGLSIPIFNLVYNTSIVNSPGSAVTNITGNLNYYTPTAASPFSSPPSIEAPVDRISSCFTGRESELAFIDREFASFHDTNPTRVVVHGMPGLGKSQLVLRYAHQAFNRHTYSHIFWLSATTVEKVTQGLARILVLVDDPDHDDRNRWDQAVQLVAVRRWLEHSQNYGCHRWLLILDNVTEDTVQFIRENMPQQNPSGSILITTRTQHVAKAAAKVAGQEHTIFELKALSTEHSVDLLLRKAGIQSKTPNDLESAEKLVRRIGCLPLAVEQAGSYMKSRGFKNVKQLQMMYDEQGLQKVISWESSLSPVPYEEKSIFAALIIQAEMLEEIDPYAYSLLLTISFFDPENIPIDILSLGARSISDKLESCAAQYTRKRKRDVFPRLLKKLHGMRQTDSWPDIPPSIDVSDPLYDVPTELKGLIELICSEERMQNVLRHFEDLSIAQPLHGDKPSLRIHDCIQWVLQQSATPERKDGCRALANALLFHAFPASDDPEEPKSWDEYERYTPHFRVLANHEEPSDVFSNKHMHANHLIARYFIARGRYKEAEMLLDRVMVYRKTRLGSNNKGTLNVMHDLARVYEKLERYYDAEILYGQVLAGRENLLGADHRETLKTVQNLAVIFHDQGMLDEAKSLYLRALAGNEKQRGAHHPSTLTTVHSLAVLYYSQGIFDKAEKLFERALAGQEKQIGADHPDTLSTVHHIAHARKQQGRYEEAEKLYKRAMLGLEAKLGLDHPNTQKVIKNLAALYETRGRPEEASMLRERARS